MRFLRQFLLGLLLVSAWIGFERWRASLSPPDLHQPLPQPSAAQLKPVTHTPIDISVPKPRPTPRIEAQTSPQPAHSQSEPDGVMPLGPHGKPLIEFEVRDGLAVAGGDLILGRPEDAGIKKGFAEISEPKLWDAPVIPYLISPELPNPERVDQAIEYLRRNTRISFIPFHPGTHKDGVVFEPGAEHCLSLLGKAGGIQPIRLAAECQMTEILHEILHTLGFVHEQSRPDRDQFVEVIWDHIEDKYQSQFAKFPETFMRAAKDSPFDFRSVMLYRPDLFAKSPGLATLKSKTGDSIQPTTSGMSDSDLKRLYRLFDL